jgi:hypothetical protein
LVAREAEFTASPSQKKKEKKKEAKSYTPALKKTRH